MDFVIGHVPPPKKSWSSLKMPGFFQIRPPLSSRWFRKNGSICVSLCYLRKMRRQVDVYPIFSESCINNHNMNGWYSNWPPQWSSCSNATERYATRSLLWTIYVFQVAYRPLLQRVSLARGRIMGKVFSDVFISIPCIQQSHLDLETLDYTFDMLRHQNRALTFWEVHIWIPSSSFQWSIGTNQPTNQNPLEKTEKRWEFCWVDEPGFGDHAKCTPSTCGT